MTDATSQADRARSREILRRLRRAHGRPKPRRRRDPVDVLVATVLSQNTTDTNSGAAFDRLRKRFADWDAVADARVDAIERAIRSAGLSRRKAPRIRALLRGIREQRGRISLEHLRRVPAGRAYDDLVALDGVGPKTALCVLLFALGKNVFPVDTHVARLSRRLGLLGDGTPDARAHEVLTPKIAPRDRYAMHLLLIAHGRQTCRARSPRCRQCCLLDLCPTGRQSLRA
jgi:endonuclease-3